MQTRSVFLPTLVLMLLLHAAAVAETVTSGGTSTEGPAGTTHPDCPGPDGEVVILPESEIIDGELIDPLVMPEPRPVPDEGGEVAEDGEVLITDPGPDDGVPPEEWCLPPLYDGEGPPPDGEVIYYAMGGSAAENAPHHNPEPSSLILAGVGASLLGGCALRRNGRRR